MDRRKLIAAIVERTGIKLDADDPAFLLVELNHLVFEESGSEVAKQISVAADKFGAITTRNVDDFVAVANEALSKFIHRTNELKTVLEAISAAPQHKFIQAPQNAPAVDKKELQSSFFWWLIPMVFILGVLAGVVLVNMTDEKAQPDTGLVNKADTVRPDARPAASDIAGSSVRNSERRKMKIRLE